MKHALAGWISVWAVFGSLLSGCTSTKISDTARTAKEQLLISNAVDQALDKVDFSAFSGASLFLDHQYLESVDKNYVVSSVRHRVLNAGGRLVDKPDDAEIILEVRSGGVGTNNSESFVGIPEFAVPGPVPVSIPEVQLFTRARQTGIAKIGLVAYDAKTRAKLGEGGVTLARSDDNNWFLLGVGPFTNGSIHHELDKSLAVSEPHQSLPVAVAFEVPGETFLEPSRLKLASEETESTDKP